MIIKSFILSTLNQALSSGTNFMIGVYLVRVLSKDEYGLYGVGFAIALFYYSIGFAIFLLQMTVHYHDKSIDNRDKYVKKMFIAMLYYSFITWTFLILIHLAFFGLNIIYIKILLAIVIYSVGLLCKDFFSRYFYILNKESRVFIQNAIIAVSVLGLFVVFKLFNVELSVPLVLFFVGLSQVFGAIAGATMVGKQWQVVVGGALEVWEEFREAFSGGRWAAVAYTSFFLRSQVHTMAVVTFVGISGVGELNAARLLVTPAVLMIPALCQVAMPRLSAIRHKGVNTVVMWSLVFAGLLLGISLFYNGIVLIFFDQIRDLVLGEKYDDIYQIFILWGLYACLLSLRNAAELYGQVMKEFKSLGILNVFVAIFAISLTFLCTIYYGLIGAMYGLVLSEFLLVISQLIYFSKSIRTKRSVVSV